MNILRGVNKWLGSPVNRINIMAKYAVRGEQILKSSKSLKLEKIKKNNRSFTTIINQNLNELKFNFHLLLIDFFIYVLKYGQILQLD